MAGENRIDARFAQLREEGRTALVPFLTAGDPDLATPDRPGDPGTPRAVAE